MEDDWKVSETSWACHGNSTSGETRGARFQRANPIRTKRSEPQRSGHLTVGYAAGLDFWDLASGKKAGSLEVTPTCLAFSPDGKHLATGGRDHTVLIWPAPAPEKPADLKALTNEERESWWTKLGDGDAVNAFRAADRMAQHPEQALAILKQKLRPVTEADPATVARHIARLNSPKFAERDQAIADLEAMGDGVVHLIAKAILAAETLEVRRRLEGVLTKSDTFSNSGLRDVRGVMVLEWIGTAAARDQLTSLSSGAPRARLTMEAKAALQRME